MTTSTAPKQTKKQRPGNCMAFHQDKKDDVGQIRTDAPEGTRFLVLRDNHSATTPRNEWF